MISLPNCVLNDSHRGDGHVYLLVGNYFSDALRSTAKLVEINFVGAKQ